MEPEMFNRLVMSIKKWGFLVPLLVQHHPESEHPYVIADGLHRREAGQVNGMDKFPCIDCTGLSQDEIEQLRLSLNRIHGELDLSIVATMFGELSENKDITIDDMEVTGFSKQEISSLLDSLNREDQDDLEPEDVTTGDKDPEQPSPFVLEVEFNEKATYQLVRRRLKRAAGKGGTLAQGLLNVLGEGEG
jgi:ParB-like chromosome segregation protein Spo0J